jgi:RNA polymerase sigma-70 factor (ECF subfamily)
VEPLPNDRSLTESASADLVRLIEAMEGGSERALEDLYDATVGKLYTVAAAILRSVEDAEEVVCMTYAYAWANAASFDSTRGNVLSWLLMLCRSRALDRLRQRRSDLIAADVTELDNMRSEESQPEDILSLLQQHGHVRAALLKLTPERRRLVSLAFLQGLSHQQIAQETGMALGTVKSHLRRALTQLRAQLEAV